jgi:hypothetical protein
LPAISSTWRWRLGARARPRSAGRPRALPGIEFVQYRPKGGEPAVADRLSHRFMLDCGFDPEFVRKTAAVGYDLKLCLPRQLALVGELAGGLDGDGRPAPGLCFRPRSAFWAGNARGP